MKVGIETSSLHWSRRGGVSRLLQNMLRAYQTKEKDFDIFSFHYLPGKDPIYQSIPDITPEWPKRLPGKLTEKFMPVAVRGRDLDLVHYPCEDLSPLFWVAAPKIVVTVHAAALHSLPAKISGVRQPRSWWISLRYLHHFISRVITDSEFAKNEIGRHYQIPLKKIRVVPLGVDHDIFYPHPVNQSDRNKLQRRYSIPGPYLLDVCSSYQALKNIPRLIEAFAGCRKLGLNQYLVIAGPGGGWQAQKVTETIKKHNLEQSVILTGHIREEDLPLLYRAADLFVFPSLYEGFGLPVLEAMACGCPVITSQITSLPEITGEAGKLIDPYNIEELISSIMQIAQDKALREQMRKQGLKQADTFSWDKTAKMTTDIYKECRDSYQPGKDI